MSSLLSNDLFLCAVLAVLVALGSTAFGLLGFMTGRSPDLELRPYVNIALTMSCLFIPVGLFVMSGGYAMVGVILAWMIGVFIGRRIRNSSKPE